MTALLVSAVEASRRVEQLEERRRRVLERDGLLEGEAKAARKWDGGKRKGKLGLV